MRCARSWAHEWETDRALRFKQVDMRNELFDLFVDLPGSLSCSLPPELQPPERRSRPSNDIPATATLLLDARFQKAMPFVVLQGAPGQGKSAITQYLCQIHRGHLLGRPLPETLPTEHRAAAVRLPFRIELRLLAVWFGQQEESTRTIEVYLAAQIARGSGGVGFDVTDLHAVISASPVLLVFDGLDEAPNIDRRQQIIKAIHECVVRLRSVARSLQVIVTTRPAAFSSSRGLSDEYPHLTLEAITSEQIKGYGERWMTAGKLSEEDRESIRHILDTRLQEPHLSDLARNPMQLAILMSLIHTRGASLPDKRTALYDSYVELFFDREGNKSNLVRDHRQRLIEIHQYLAWVLHARCESGASSGLIAFADLRTLLIGYLQREGHPVDLVDDLFTGVIERIVLIESRVEGYAEFEVQTVREYFAARFLYETAPYSPPGRERPGTKPERFDAIARSPYWMNVTRFYAGCFSKGELPALFNCISDLLADSFFGLLSYPRVLAMHLLNDWVFSQDRRSAGALLDTLLQTRNFWLCTACPEFPERRAPRFSEPASTWTNAFDRARVLQHASDELARFPPDDAAGQVIDVWLCNHPTCLSLWEERFQRSHFRRARARPGSRWSRGTPSSALRVPPFGSRWTQYEQAARAAGISLTPHEYSHATDLHDDTVPLCERACHARSRTIDVGWWRRQFSSARTTMQRMFCGLLLHRWAAYSTLLFLLPELQRFCDDLSTEDWMRFAGGCQYSGYRVFHEQDTGVEIPPDTLSEQDVPFR